MSGGVPMADSWVAHPEWVPSWSTAYLLKNCRLAVLPSWL